MAITVPSMNPVNSHILAEMFLKLNSIFAATLPHDNILVLKKKKMECYTTHWQGSNFFSLQHFIAPALDLMACLPSQQRREAIKVLNPRREQSITAMKTRIYSAILMRGENSSFSEET